MSARRSPSGTRSNRSCHRYGLRTSAMRRLNTFSGYGAGRTGASIYWCGAGRTDYSAYLSTSTPGVSVAALDFRSGQSVSLTWAWYCSARGASTRPRGRWSRCTRTGRWSTAIGYRHFTGISHPSSHRWTAHWTQSNTAAVSYSTRYL